MEHTWFPLLTDRVVRPAHDCPVVQLLEIVSEGKRARVKAWGLKQPARVDGIWCINELCEGDDCEDGGGQSVNRVICSRR